MLSLHLVLMTLPTWAVYNGNRVRPIELVTLNTLLV